MTVERLPKFIRENYEIREWKHACAILYEDYPSEYKDVIEVLQNFRLKKSWIKIGGGQKSKVADAIDSELYARGWIEKQFEKQNMRALLIKLIVSKME